MMESHGGTHKRLISSLRCKFVVLMHEIVVASILLGLGQDWCNPSLTVSENSYNPASSCWDLHLKLRDEISLQTLPRRQSALQRMFSTTKKSSPSFMTITHWTVYCIISLLMMLTGFVLMFFDIAIPNIKIVISLGYRHEAIILIQNVIIGLPKQEQHSKVTLKDKEMMQWLVRGDLKLEVSGIKLKVSTLKLNIKSTRPPIFSLSHLTIWEITHHSFTTFLRLSKACKYGLKRILLHGLQQSLLPRLPPSSVFSALPSLLAITVHIGRIHAMLDPAALSASLYLLVLDLCCSQRNGNSDNDIIKSNSSSAVKRNRTTSTVDVLILLEYAEVHIENENLGSLYTAGLTGFQYKQHILLSSSLSSPSSRSPPQQSRRRRGEKRVRDTPDIPPPPDHEHLFALVSLSVVAGRPQKEKHKGSTYKSKSEHYHVDAAVSTEASVKYDAVLSAHGIQGVIRSVRGKRFNDMILRLHRLHYQEDSTEQFASQSDSSKIEAVVISTEHGKGCTLKPEVPDLPKAMQEKWIHELLARKTLVPLLMA